MFDQLLEWVKSVLGESYEYSAGMWIDHASLSEKSICAIHGNGGPAPDVDDRRQRFRVLILGPRNGRENRPALQADIEKLAQATMDDSRPCGAASVRGIGEPIGPGYTTENRAWYSLDVEVLF